MYIDVINCVLTPTTASIVVVTKVIDSALKLLASAVVSIQLSKLAYSSINADKASSSHTYHLKIMKKVETLESKTTY